jgi:hypothetical protein
MSKWQDLSWNSKGPQATLLLLSLREAISRYEAAKNAKNAKKGSLSPIADAAGFAGGKETIQRQTMSSWELIPGFFS